ncbi:MAG: hypothetical protein QOH76_1872, partial [Thermoleophilaceae bacterium]|nr:hypothetical protein [Thermoleophilaceae bacterium]
MTTIRRALFLSLVLFVAAPGVAAAGPILDRAARCLEQRAVCVDPGARNALGTAEADALESDV